MIGVAFWSASIPMPTPVIMSVRATTTTYVSAAASATAAEAVASRASGAGDRNGLRQASVLDEKGQMVSSMPQQHDVMTGSDSDGRAFTDGLDHTCNNWTSDQMTIPLPPNSDAGVPPERARAMLGHSDRGLQGAGNTSWNAAHMSQGCTKQALINTGGSGRLYCFAIN